MFQTMFIVISATGKKLDWATIVCGTSVKLIATKKTDFFWHVCVCTLPSFHFVIITSSSYSQFCIRGSCLCTKVRATTALKTAARKHSQGQNPKQKWNKHPHPPTHTLSPTQFKQRTRIPVSCLVSYIDLYLREQAGRFPFQRTGYLSALADWLHAYRGFPPSAPLLLAHFIRQLLGNKNNSVTEAVCLSKIFAVVGTRDAVSHLQIQWSQLILTFAVSSFWVTKLRVEFQCRLLAEEPYILLHSFSL